MPSLLFLLCLAGKHDWECSPSRLVCWCRREGCDAYWEYD